MGPMGQPPMAPPLAPGQRPIVRRNLNAGGGYWALRTNRIRRNIFDGPYRSLGIVVSCAVGIAIAIAIIGAANGVQQKITSQIPSNTSSQPQQLQDKVNQIDDILSQTRTLLTVLSVGLTGAIVGLVTWISTGQRRRSISLQVQEGQRRNDLIVELLGESLFLCTFGGLIGVVLGLVLCNVIHNAISLLPISPDAGSILAIFPSTTLLAFGVAGAIVSYYTTHTDTRTSL